MPLIKSRQEYVRERLHLLMSAAAVDIGRAVRPIYCATDNGKAAHLGSCTLVKRKTQSLLLTAAHVIDANKRTGLYISSDGALIKLEGDGVATTAPRGIRDRDSFDFGILSLSGASAQALEKIRHVEEHEIERRKERRGYAYMAFGYPNSKNKPDHFKQQIVPRRFSYGGPIVTKGAGAAHHLKMQYEKKSRTVEGDVVTSIEPTGMSGGAIFALGQILEGSNPSEFMRSPFQLAGVLIERRKDEKVIVATDIETVLSVLDD
jgi:hypothetical protein